MKRFWMTGWIVVAAAVAMGVGCGVGNAAGVEGKKMARPNILLILADDLGFSDLGCYGSEIATPNLDRLASRGVRFTQFYNSSRCCPTRASLLTGLYPQQAGMGDMAGGSQRGPLGYEGRLVERCVTMPEVLKGAGYQCFMVGKWHLGARPNPIARGFDEFYGMIGGFNTCWEEKPYYTRLPEDRSRRSYGPGEFYSTDVFGDYALDFLAQARQTPAKPWFLYLAFNAAHFPLHAPEREIAKYEQLYAQGWDRIREGRLERQKKLGIVPEGTALTPRSFVPANWANKETGWADKYNPAWEALPADRRADLARRMAVYAGMIDRMDQNIGRVVVDLRRHKELENTLIIFLSDNGACAEWDPYGFDVESGPKNVLHAGEDLKKVGGPGSYVSYGSGWANACNAPWRLYKHYGQEGGIATGCIVHWPAGTKRKGKIESTPGHIIDLMPTLVEVAGAKYPERVGEEPILPMEGRSLVPVLRGEGMPERTLFFEHEGHRAVREGHWKLVALKGGAWELYDFTTDRTEREDLAEVQVSTLSRLAAAWDEWAERCYVRRPRAAAASPKIANKPITISCDVKLEKPEGVILAQGGNQQGYALWLKEGRVVFSVRENGVVTSVTDGAAPSERFTVRARLERGGGMELVVKGREAVRGQAAGLIPVQPVDELSVGEDTASAVGDYRGPNPLQGSVENVLVTAE